MTALLLVPAVLILTIYLVIICICKAAGDADRAIERMRIDDDARREPRRTNGGWRL